MTRQQVVEALAALGPVAKGTLSDEEILLRLKQLRTTFSYYLSLGLSYSFGSVMSRSVNPRFGTSYYY